MSEQTTAGGATVLKPVKESRFGQRGSGHSSDAAYPFKGIGKDPGFRVWKRMDGSVDVSGEVDFCTAESFRAALSQVAPSSGTALIGLRDLQFIDSAGIRAIVSTACSFPAVEFKITSSTSIFVKCWELLGCSSLASNVQLCATGSGHINDALSPVTQALP